MADVEDLALKEIPHHEMPEHALRAYAKAVDDAHPDGCTCEQCYQLSQRSDYYGTDAYIEENMAAGRAPQSDEDKEFYEELARKLEAEEAAKLEAMLQQQAAILSGDTSVCRACGEYLPDEGRRRGPKRKYHAWCAEAAAKRKQRSTTILRGPKGAIGAKSSYVVAGYTGRRRHGPE
jgi:hypothetical protein